MRDKPIQRVELTEFYDVSIFCPFCGQCIMDMDPQGEDPIKACPHTLFLATDEGFEYRSKRFDENLGLEGMDESKIPMPESGLDGLTDQVAIVDSIKFALYAGAPAGLGAYVGFAPEPLEDE